VVNVDTPRVDVPSIPVEVAVVTGEQLPVEKKSSPRRGPNRRRPRNPNYKKTESEANTNGSDNGETPFTAMTGEGQAQSYDRDFAGRIDRIERSEVNVVSATAEPKQTVSEIVSVVKATQETNE
jgi:ribonuclease E